MKIKKNGGGGSGRGVESGGRVGGQGRCEQRSEVFVKIQKKNIFSFFLGGGGGGQVGGRVGGRLRRLLQQVTVLSR